VTSDKFVGDADEGAATARWLARQVADAPPTPAEVSQAMLACAEAGDEEGLAALKAAHGVPGECDDCGDDCEGCDDDPTTTPAKEPRVIDPQLVRAFVAHAMLSHPSQAQEIAAHAAADPEGTAELAAEYAATHDDDEEDDGTDEPSDLDDDTDGDEDSEIDGQPEPAPPKPAPSPVVKAVTPPVPGGRKGRR